MMDNIFNNMSIKEKTDAFNQLTVEERLLFLNLLSESEKEKFIKDIRNQAVKDFWNHERKAILNGENTRNWTPEQIESIMHFSDKTGKMSSNASKTYLMADDVFELAGKGSKKVYYGHHMFDVSSHPEYAGDWGNIQALKEHYYGAHKNHETRTLTEGFYEVNTLVD